MNDQFIDTYPDFRRAQFMLEQQIATAGDLIRFWVIYGPYDSTHERTGGWY